jgi:hypothetical protein
MINKQFDFLASTIGFIFKSKIKSAFLCLSFYNDIKINKNKSLAVLSGFNLRNKMKVFFNLFKQNSKAIYEKKRDLLSVCSTLNNRCRQTTLS